jgi:hypothetical protein
MRAVPHDEPSTLFGWVQTPLELQESSVQGLPSSVQRTPEAPLLHVVVLVLGVQTWHRFAEFC